MVLTEPSNMSEYDRKTAIQAFDNARTGVKGLIDAGVDIIPRIFLHEQYMLEKKTSVSIGSKLSIPVIDLGCLNNDAASRRELIDRVRYACEEWGFFQITNHGIPSHLLNRVLECVKEFHELESDIKKPYYSRGFRKKVVYNSNFDLHQAPSANWRDTLYLIMAPNPPKPEEIPRVCR